MHRVPCRPLCQSFLSPSDTQNLSTEKNWTINVPPRRRRKGTGSCECGSGITRVVMTQSALCSLALLGPSIKALCQEPCLAMAWSPFCSTNSWIWLTVPFKHVSLHVPRNFPDKSSPYPEAIIFLLDFSPVSACCLTPLHSWFHNVGASGCLFLRCKPGCPVLRQHHGHRESFLLSAFLFSPLWGRVLENVTSIQWQSAQWFFGKFYLERE